MYVVIFACFFPRITQLFLDFFIQFVEKGFYGQRFYTAIVLLAPTLEGEVCGIEMGLVRKQCGQLLPQEGLEVRLLFVELLYRMGGFVVLFYEADSA
ncbi:hypothetical protein CER19_03390 [Pseudomonas sp. GL93]|nr:hypothetical protein CER19_03390 [Pseudomonas sp. GL93]